MAEIAEKITLLLGEYGRMSQASQGAVEGGAQVGLAARQVAAKGDERRVKGY